MTFLLSTEAMILRAARAAVREHAPRDVLACDFGPALEDLRDKLYYLQDRRTYHFDKHDQPARTVPQTVATAIVKPVERNPRVAGEVTVEVIYGTTHAALYAVAPSPELPARCWAD